MKLKGIKFHDLRNKPKALESDDVMWIHIGLSIATCKSISSKHTVTASESSPTEYASCEKDKVAAKNCVAE